VNLLAAMHCNGLQAPPVLPGACDALIFPTDIRERLRPASKSALDAIWSWLRAM
jgi:hypothetical protein